MGTGFTRGLGKIGHMLKRHEECLNATLAFASSSGGVGYLSCGLITGLGTITSYVIEWHLNSPTGAIVMLTGYNPSETVNAIHPFTNEPVQSGNLYAVIKYIIIDGIKYSAYYRAGQFSPDLKICFSYVPVTAVTCANGGAGIYSHIFTYVNTIDSAVLANRVIRYELNSETTYVAWKFTGFNVVDQIKISYVSITDPSHPQVCSYWRVGSAVSTNFTSSPKAANLSYLQQVIKLANFYSYNSGDYLLIEIVPRVIDTGNTNTNWTLELKCLSSFSDYSPPANSRKLDLSSVRLTYLPAACGYSLYYKHINRYAVPTHFANYLQNNYISSLLGIGYNTGTNEFFVNNFYNYATSSNQGIIPANTSCFNGAGIRYQKIGPDIIITFTSSVDYNRSKTQYTNTIANALWTSYVADNTNIEYYKFFLLLMTVGTSCGDTLSTMAYYIHHDSVFAWDDANNKVTITLFTITNGYAADTSCSTVRSGIDGYVSNANGLRALSNFDNSSIAQNNVVMFGVSMIMATPYNNNVSVLEGAFSTNTNVGTFVEMFTPDQWTSYSASYGSSGNVFGYVTGERGFTITNMADGANYYRIENLQDSDTGLKLTDSVLELTRYAGVNYDGICKKAGNVISTGGWSNFSAFNLGAIGGTHAQTSSTSYITGVVNDFNFNIPTGKTILGITFDVRFISVNSLYTAYMKFRFSKDAGVNWSSYSDEISCNNVFKYVLLAGAPNDLLGISLTPAEANSTDFYVEISGRSGNATTTCSLDYFRTSLYYSF